MMWWRRLAFLPLAAGLLLYLGAGKKVSVKAEWTEVASGVWQLAGLPCAYAIVDHGAATFFGAPRQLIPGSLPPRCQRCDLVLLTHHHRDSTAQADSFIKAGILVRASKTSAPWLTREGVAKYWQISMPVPTPGRFPSLFERYWSDWSYLVHPVGIGDIHCDLEDGQTIEWHDWTIEVMATPGHSKDHLAFIAHQKAKARSETPSICFCGDALCGKNQIWSPYTTDWHHVNDDGSRAGAESLRRLAKRRPTLLCPEHGLPITENVAGVLEETARSLDEVAFLKSFDKYTRQRLGNPPRYAFLAPEQVGSANPQGNPKPWSRLAPHLFLTGNTFALASRDGLVLLVDPYSQDTVEHVEELKRDYGYGPVQVCLVTHAHNDHYTGIFALPRRDQFKVWTLDRVADAIDHPFQFQAPYLDAREVRADVRLKAETTVHWREYDLKIHHLPGQTDFTMGVEIVIDGKKCFFTADNFFHMDQYTGSGGWSGRNRALPLGYAESARMIIKAMPDWVLAEHGGPFVFDEKDFRRRLQWAEQAGNAADHISPTGRHVRDWDPCRIHIEPLIQKIERGQAAHCRVVANNPLASEEPLTLHLAGRGLVSDWSFQARIPAKETFEKRFELPVASDAPPGRHIFPMVAMHGNEEDGADAFLVLDVQ